MSEFSRIENWVKHSMLSHIIEVLSMGWSGVVLGHGLAQGLGRD